MRKLLAILLVLLVAGAIYLQTPQGRNSALVTAITNAMIMRLAAEAPTAAHWDPPVQPAGQAAIATREPCRDVYPQRKAWFGDLHVHTNVSFDAGSEGLSTTVDDAYRFARGEAINLTPDSANPHIRQLALPLDFAAVTDHAEWLGEQRICTDPEQDGYQSKTCKKFRGDQANGNGMAFIRLIGRDGNRVSDICGEDAKNCRDNLLSIWQRNQQFTEQHYDRSSDCSFTTFHGYEYSNNRGMSKVHRNVIYRNERVPELPVSSTEATNELELWEQMDKLCNQSGGPCEAISIPHNPNVSNGKLFTVPWRALPLAEQQRQAALREQMEPIVEMMQIKGESECKPGLWQVLGEDEFCGFEKMRGLGEQAPEHCEGETSDGAIRGVGCQSRLDFARYAIIEGMAEQQRIGVNPFRFGFIGSTDTHNGTPGDTAEDDFGGCCANRDTTVEERLDPATSFAGQPATFKNPGGLVGVWAERNTRDSLFDAMQRREVFATSGTRIEPRFFAGDAIPDTACEQDFIQQADTNGTAMGGILHRENSEPDKSPVFAAAATADPNAAALQRLQIIKVWHDSEGNFHQQVHEIAGSPDNGASVDLANCQRQGEGHSQLCATWRDPAFDAKQPAAYYLRALENPSCRWSWQHCLSLPEDQRPSSCSDPDLPKTVQERAWSSPIWYQPDASL